MYLLVISKDDKGLLVKFPTSPLPYRLPVENIEAFKADGDHWDDWSLDQGASFSTAMSDSACKEWCTKLTPVVPIPSQD